MGALVPGLVKKASAEDSYDPSKFEPLIKDLQDIISKDKYFVS